MIIPLLVFLDLFGSPLQEVSCAVGNCPFLPIRLRGENTADGSWFDAEVRVKEEWLPMKPWISQDGNGHWFLSHIAEGLDSSRVLSEAWNSLSLVLGRRNGGTICDESPVVSAFAREGLQRLPCVWDRPVLEDGGVSRGDAGPVGADLLS